MTKEIKYLENPYKILMKEKFIKNKINTPFGSIESEVSLFPILYLIILYTIALFLPWKIWGKQINF